MKLNHKYKFSCTECGDCCRRPGVVEFDEEDFGNVLSTLNISRRIFIERYFCTEDTHGGVELWVEENSPCAFLGSDNRCGIFEARPKQCRSYPFWPELMDLKDWLAEKAFCPGIDGGRLYSRKEVEKLLHDQSATLAKE